MLRRFARTYAITAMLPATHLEPGVVVQKCPPTPGILDVGRVPTGSTVRPRRSRRTCAGRASSGAPARHHGVEAPGKKPLVLNLGNGVDAAFAGLGVGPMS